MALLKLRGIASVGLIKDTPPAALPTQAFTRLQNVQIRGRAIQRSGVFRELGADMNTAITRPIHAIARVLNGDNPDSLYLYDRGGYIHSTDGKTVTDVSVEGHTSNSIGTRVTTATLGGCTYFARNSDKPVGIAPTDTAFSNVLTGSDWEDYTWRVVRAFDDRLFLFSGADGSTLYDRRVMWSGPTYDGAIVADWDTASRASSSGWVDLPGMIGEILDAQALGNQLLIYTDNSLRRLYRLGAGSAFVYGTEEVFNDDGVLATGLVVSIAEVGHFVVGKNSIYLTDGVTRKQIAMDVVENYFRDIIDVTQLHRAFAFADYRNSEVWVCYVSNDSEAHWTPDTYCNQALVWSWKSGTFSFRDLPNVGAVASFDYNPDALTWADTEGGTITWDTLGGTWALVAGIPYWFPVLTSEPYTNSDHTIDLDEWTTRSLMVYDDFERGRLLASTSRNAGFSLLERIAIPFDEMQFPIWTTKELSKLVPMIAAPTGETSLVAIGGSQQPEVSYTWEDYQEWDPASSRWVNSRITGRYLGYRVRAEGTNGMSFTGADLDVDVIAEF